MPILDVEVVADSGDGLAGVNAQALADAAAAVLHAPPQRVWVRLRHLPSAYYAENGAPASTAPWPVFVTILHAHPPQGDALQQEVQALTAALAKVLGRPAERVHLQYAPAGVGRQAFGGRLVT
jgi:phenylpyruvate tautomerase PptA (4-oxalocrotonate tautomerase family)